LDLEIVQGTFENHT